MAQVPPRGDPDVEPVSRPRSCTWPLPRPEPTTPTGSLETSSGGSHQEPRVGGGASPPRMEENRRSPSLNPHPPSGGSPTGVPGQRKGGPCRRNAWGNLSYADLISRAIDSCPDKRLTLAQIYDWVVRHVPYFMDKGDSSSSAGWKNSIRHNLSLHSRFVRIQNEGTGKSSWWTLNPDGGKGGKLPRRRAASMDSSSKFVKSRGRAAKKRVTLQEGVQGGVASPGSQYPNWLGSPNSHSNEDLAAWSCFRTRTSSDASSRSGGHSPLTSNQDDPGGSEGLLVYPGSTGAKMTHLPRLPEVGQHGSVTHSMENLLDNLNLLSSTPCPSASCNPYYACPPDYHQSRYVQARIRSPTSPSVQTLPVNKPENGEAFQGACTHPSGFLKDLLGMNVDPSRIVMTSSELQRGRGYVPMYQHCSSVRGLKADRWTVSTPSPPLPNVSPPAVPCCDAAPVGAGPQGPPTIVRLRHRAHTNHGAAGGGCAVPGWGRPRSHHSELPSDLDNVDIERFECDLESVLHDTLMDGGGLEFSFDAAAAPHRFAHRVKSTTHSWVSG